MIALEPLFSQESYLFPKEKIGIMLVFGWISQKSFFGVSLKKMRVLRKK